MFLVIGSVTADLLVSVDRLPRGAGADGFRRDNLVFTERPLAVSMGGNGGNSAFVLAALGVPTQLGGALGSDLLGDALAAWLQERGVDLARLHRSDSRATSTSTILIDGAAEQFVAHHAGANTLVTWERLCEARLPAVEVLLATSYPIMNGMRPDGFARALAHVHENGGITALDIGPAIGPPLGLDEVTPLLPHVDYLLGNQHELLALTGESEPRVAALRTLNAGAQRVVVKQGDKGATLVSRREQMRTEAYRVDVHVSVGAGDSFNAGFLYALWRGDTAAQALAFGAATAALVVSNPRGIHGAPSSCQVEAFVSEHCTTG